MRERLLHLLRRLLPWTISITALAYVFGWLTDWRALLAAMKGADVPAFVAVVAIDKVAFFLGWSLLQAEAVRRFVRPVPYAQVLAVRGGSELVRAVNGNLADVAVVVGLMQVTGASLATIVAASTFPYFGHIAVLLLQATVSIPLLGGGIAANRDVAIAVGIGWLIALGAYLLVRFAPSMPRVARSSAGVWLGRVRPRALLPYFGWFLALAVVDIGFQWLATRAFGIPIPWPVLAARIPILYVAISVPSLAGFGPRELTWAYLFSEYGTRDALVAYAFATNAIFLVLHVVIGVAFLPRAIDLVLRMREARAAGVALPNPLLRDSIDP
ncbi:MAG: flippase-like domain-containing protein [Deltaproteobacteria bacterium]|nr:flippase-like domain-containing protein [Deltaproteobacteria bacterium]